MQRPSTPTRNRRRCSCTNAATRSSPESMIITKSAQPMSQASRPGLCLVACHSACTTALLDVATSLSPHVDAAGMLLVLMHASPRSLIGTPAPCTDAPPVVMMHLRNSRLMTMALSRTSSAGGELLGSASSSRRSRGCGPNAMFALKRDAWLQRAMARGSKESGRGTVSPPARRSGCGWRPCSW
jgi:hypothetical protein